MLGGKGQTGILLFLTVTSLALSSKFPKIFSRCSQVDLESFVAKPQTGCLTNVPDVNRFVGGPVCGNLFVEHGEQCDCGTPQVCLNPLLVSLCLSVGASIKGSFD